MNKKLEIIIITYNRSSNLEYTLYSLLNSEYKKINITVIDNFSNDDTEIKVKGFINKFDNLTYIKNCQNIGASANVMRAYELASKDYVWVMCDDDICNFTQIESLYRALEELPDIIVVGSPYDRDDVFDKDSLNKKINGIHLSKSKLAMVLTFLPSAIINVKKLKECNFNVGYKLANTNFPHFFWIAELFNRNWTVYILKNRTITRSNVDHGLPSNMDHINGFLEASDLVDSKIVRNQIKCSYFSNSKKNYIIQMAKIMILDSAAGKLKFKNYVKHLISINRSYLIYSLVLLTIFLMPKIFVYKIIELFRRKNFKNA
jgi:glycosyltransferase involved in cell wall biosynthesis